MGQDSLIIECSNCGAKNRVPRERLGAHPICGKCKAPLNVARLFPDRPVEVSDATFGREVLNHPGPVLLEFSAPW